MRNEQEEPQEKTGETPKTFGVLLGEEILERREARGWTQPDLAEMAFDDVEKIDSQVRLIGSYERGETAHPQARSYKPICVALGISRERINELKQQAADAKQQADAEFEELRARAGSTQELLQNTAGLTRDELELLASRFEIPAPHDLSDPQLREMLTQKAVEYRAYRAQIESLDDRVAAVANLKGAAADAAERLDFDEVEALLARVDEVETEIAAETKVARARNALLRNRVDDAARMLTAAAESFGSQSDLEAAMKMAEYVDMLFQFGNSRSVESIEAAIVLWEKSHQCLEALGENILRAVPLQNHAIGLRNISQHVKRHQKEQLLINASELLFEAQQIYRTNHQYVKLASTLYNYANTLFNLAQISEGRKVEERLNLSLAAFNEVIDFRFKTNLREDFARSLLARANLFVFAAQLNDDETSPKLLLDAIQDKYEAFLIFGDSPETQDWAFAAQSLADTISELAVITKTSEANEHFAQSHNLYCKVLEYYISEQTDYQLATANSNFSILNYRWSQHPACTDPAEKLALALEAVDQVLTVYDPDHSPYYHDKATELRDAILSAQKELNG